jgi:Holliday junction resolvase RusA-like endonuclease
MYDDPRNQVYADLIRWAWRTEGAVELGLEPFTLTVTAVFARPAGHWTTRGRLSAQGLRAGYYCTHRIDVVKAVGDALNGLAWADDRQAVAVHANKRWALQDEPPHLDVHAQALREGLDWQVQP